MYKRFCHVFFFKKRQNFINLFIFILKKMESCYLNIFFYYFCLKIFTISKF